MEMTCGSDPSGVSSSSFSSDNESEGTNMNKSLTKSRAYSSDTRPTVKVIQSFFSRLVNQPVDSTQDCPECHHDFNYYYYHSYSTRTCLCLMSSPESSSSRHPLFSFLGLFLYLKLILVTVYCWTRCLFFKTAVNSYNSSRKSTSYSKTSRSRRKLNLSANIMMPIMIQMMLRSLMVSGQNCFGGIETFEKVSMTDFDENYTPAGILLQQTDQALTRDCINLCKQQSTCLSFGLDYTKFRCAAYSINSVGRKSALVSTNATNFFEKVCYRGVTRDDYEKVCGIERLWTFERVQHAFLEGFVKIQLNNVASKSECAKACLMETSFTCRSADYDDQARICRLSKEDRRTQPQAFRVIKGSNREYIENQCAAPGKKVFYSKFFIKKIELVMCNNRIYSMGFVEEKQFLKCILTLPIEMQINCLPVLVSQAVSFLETMDRKLRKDKLKSGQVNPSVDQ